MPVCKVEKKKGFTIMSNRLLQDKRISMKSRGLLAYILSLPGDWDYTIAGLSSSSGMGKKALASGLTELENAGYMERHMLRANDGTFLDVEYVFHEEPIDAMEKAESQELEVAKDASTDRSPSKSCPSAAPIERDPAQSMQRGINFPSIDTDTPKSSKTCASYPFPHFRQTDNRETVLYKDNNKEQRTNKRNLSICQAETREQIGYQTLAEQYGRDRVDGVVDLITEVYMNPGKMITFGKNQLQTAIMQERFTKLGQEHIEYVFDSIDRQTQRIHNMKSYLLASLFNAPAIMEEDFNNRVRVDFPMPDDKKSNPP